MSFPRKIISGGQTGADLAALDFAIGKKLEIGGWAPFGMFNEAGKIPGRYRLAEAKSDKYPVRTKLNVEDSDVTVIFTYDLRSRGTMATIKACEASETPYLVLDCTLAEEYLADELVEFLKETMPRVLNVAGNRASQQPAIAGVVQRVLEMVSVLSQTR